MENKVLEIQVRDWKYGGYVVQEIEELSINNAYLTPSFNSAMKFAKEEARELGLDAVHIVATVKL